MIGVGKAAKREGLPGPATRRRTEPPNPRSTPGLGTRTGPPKSYGYELRTNHLELLFGRHRATTRRRWFRTAAHRDQAMAHEQHWHERWNLKWFRSGQHGLEWSIKPIGREA